MGLEPFGGDRTPTNIELVEEVVALAQAHGRPVATPTQAAEIIGLPSYPVAMGS
ncbi:MAG: 3-keto-5-aminohexanoate cleavage protein [Halioglobus sp.]